MLILLLWGENIATPSGYIFVFVNEMLNIINVRFPSQSMIKISPTHYTAKHPPEICSHLLPQNISSPHSGHKKNEIEGHQMTSSNHTIPLGR